jgi:hypothetical protein
MIGDAPSAHRRRRASSTISFTARSKLPSCNRSGKTCKPMRPLTQMLLLLLLLIHFVTTSCGRRERESFKHPM